MTLSKSAAVLATLFCLSGSLRAEPLSVVVQDNRFPGFPLYLAVYADDEAGWQSEPVARHKRALPGVERFTLSLDLASARYAIRAFVDLNHNGQLDTDRRDRPAEPFAHSTEDGRPSHRFHRSVFFLSAGGGQTSLTLRYPDRLIETSTNQ